MIEKIDFKWLAIWCVTVTVLMLLVSWMMSDKQVDFDTKYEVTYTSLAGKEITKKYDLPANINNIEIRASCAGYNMYVVFDNQKQSELIQHAVIDIHRFKKIILTE